MKVEFSKQVADRMLSDEAFNQLVEEAIKTFNHKYAGKMVGCSGFGLLILKESEDYLKVSICE